MKVIKATFIEGLRMNKEERLPIISPRKVSVL
jgi:hypothetical protein